MKVVTVRKFQARGKLLREFLNDQSWEKSSYFHNYFSQSVSAVLVTYRVIHLWGDNQYRGALGYPYAKNWMTLRTRITPVK